MVYDEGGQAIRRVDGKAEAGFQRVAWDLRFPASRVVKHTEDSEEDFPDIADLGPLVVPGTYSVRMFEKVGGVVTEVAGSQTFKVMTEQWASMTAADQRAQEEFLRKVARLYRALSGSLHTADELASRLKEIRAALQQTPVADKQLSAAADSLEQRNRDILRALRGDVEIAKRNDPVPSSIENRVGSIMDGERFSLAKPTQSDVESYGIAAAEFADQLAKLRTLMDVDLVKLEKDMEAAGAPWTPGRVPEWQEK
jgi:uncharacterized protein YoxC